MESGKKTKRIAVLVDSIVEFHREILNGFESIVLPLGYSITVFAGRELNPLGRRQAYSGANRIYDLFNAEAFDGLLIYTAQVGQHLSDTELEQFIGKLGPIPKVGLTRAVENLPTVRVDSRTGMRQMMAHLIQKRGYSNFVLLRGYPNNPDSKIREEVFREELERFGIPLDPRFVIDGEFDMSPSFRKMLELLQETHDFECVVALNDSMAYGAIQALQERGLVVPTEVAVVGFDDQESSRFTSPPLTTVSQPLFDQGVEAARIMLERFEGNEFPSLVELGTKIVVRQSCGFVPKLSSQTVEKFLNEAPNVPAAQTLQAFNFRIPKPPEFMAFITHTWEVQLERLFKLALMDPNGESAFLGFWRSSIHQSATMSTDLSWWQHVLAELQLQVSAYLTDLPTLRRVGYLVNQAQSSVLEGSQLSWVTTRLREQSELFEFNLVEMALMSSSAIGDLCSSLDEYLTLMGVNRCYLAMYETQNDDCMGATRVILAHNLENQNESTVEPFSAPLVETEELLQHIQGSVVVYPLFHGNRQFGLLIIDTKNHDGHVIERLQQSISWALNNINQIETLRGSYEGAIRAIGLALETRDAETAGHTDRVAHLAGNLGKAIGLNEIQLRSLLWGSYLHDIGKLAIPDSILFKPGKLSTEEFEIMKKHVTYGLDLAARLPFLPDGVEKVIRSHHERYDGKGYPDQLKGEEIDLCARIFSICDVYDALISNRPYKKAFPKDVALEEIRKSGESGQLDPHLVKLFLEQMSSASLEVLQAAKN